MKRVAYLILAVAAHGAPAHGAQVLFDFDSGPIHAPITSAFPLDLTVDTITAHFSATGQGFSIQDTPQSIGVLPAGFSGLGITPGSVFAADLLISFPHEVVTDFSIMFAPQELALDTSATMRVTAYSEGAFVGTSTAVADNPNATWPSGTLSFSSAQGFNSVVIHYDQPPPNAAPEDWGPIFAADNMIVTATVVPEPASLPLALMAALAAAMMAIWGRRHRFRGVDRG